MGLQKAGHGTGAGAAQAVAQLVVFQVGMKWIACELPPQTLESGSSALAQRFARVQVSAAHFEAFIQPLGHGWRPADAQQCQGEQPQNMEASSGTMQAHQA